MTADDRFEPVAVALSAHPEAELVVVVTPSALHARFVERAVQKLVRERVFGAPSYASLIHHRYRPGGKTIEPLEVPKAAKPAEAQIVDALYAYIRNGVEPEISARNNLPTMQLVTAASPRQRQAGSSASTGRRRASLRRGATRVVRSTKASF